MTLFDTTPNPAQPETKPVVVERVELVWVLSQRYRFDGLWREISTASYRGVTLLKCQTEADPPVYDSMLPRTPRSLHLPDVLLFIAQRVAP
jgi:hypothetical protein